MEGRSRKRLLSEEELELWAHVTRQDEPLARLRSNGSDRQAGTAAVTLTADPAQPGTSPARSSHGSPAGQPGLPVKDASSASPAPEPFDPRLGKQIARGRREIDARLDLHGLRQPDAYSALRRFLTQAQAEGHRHVLVITGKGGKNDEGAERDIWNAGQRGVLRRLVPRWLSEPDFRAQVVSFTESALKHGGSGALYVTVRKGLRRSKP